MKYLLRPYVYAGAGLLAFATAVAPPTGAQPGISHLIQELKPLLSHSTPGYLGVLVTNVDNDSVQKLRLKDNKGALVTLIDHDAPAGAALHLNDVVLSVNGETVDGAEHFGRILKEIPAGKKVTLVISREGAQQSITLQLVDRKAMEQDVWNKMNSSAFPPPPQGNTLFSGGGDAMPGWHMPLFTSSLNVGALIEPLTAQMADYLGVPAGIMVKQVARKSEAEAAGLKPHDVILKVGTETITTSADWDRALRSNQGKSVQVTVLRDRRQQVITLQVDSKHRRSQTVWTDMFPQDECPQMAMVDPQPGPWFADETERDADKLRSEINRQTLDDLRRQAERMRGWSLPDPFPQLQMNPEQLQEFQHQLDEFQQSFKAEDFRFSPEQMEELNRAMEQFRQSFKADDFKVDPKTMEELRKEMEEFRQQCPKSFHLEHQEQNRVESGRPGQPA
jgi:membrane-associated protease RseP (regulator of RpoE activity)